MSARPRLSYAIYALLGVPFVGTLWVPFYDRAEPSLGGVPFFYWYLFLFVLVGAAINAIVYLATRAGRAGKSTGPG